MDRYRTKRKLMRPVTALRRRRRAGRTDEFTRGAYESADYRPAMRRFFLASAATPELLIDVDLPDGAVVLDVGAYRGEWSERIVQRAAENGGRDVRVHAFEPEPHVLRRLREGIGQDPHVEVHPYGLGGRERVERMTIGGPGSSVFAHPDTTRLYGDVDIELRDVHSVLSALSVDHIELAKINIEGGEFELIDRLHETGWLGRIGTLIVQFHEFGPDAYRGRRRNRRQLGETHRCTWNYTWVYERWDRK